MYLSYDIADIYLRSDPSGGKLIKFRHLSFELRINSSPFIFINNTHYKIQ